MANPSGPLTEDSDPYLRGRNCRDCGLTLEQTLRRFRVPDSRQAAAIGWRERDAECAEAILRAAKHWQHRKAILKRSRNERAQG